MAVEERLKLAVWEYVWRSNTAMLASEAAALELSEEALWVPMITCSVNIVSIFWFGIPEVVEVWRDWTF